MNVMMCVGAAVILAGGISSAGFFIGNTMYKSKIALNTVTVKGLAERRVSADQANWKISYSVTGTTKGDIPELYKQVEIDEQKVLDCLKAGGIEESEINIGVISYSSQQYRNENKVLVDERHTLSGVVEIQTNRVTAIESVRPMINKLMIEGINITNHAPQYRFTKLNEIKPEMLKEATENARVAASEFATNSGSKVGRIRSARQGGFTIVDVGETYGDTKRLTKDVRVVTTSEFYVDN